MCESPDKPNSPDSLLQRVTQMLDDFGEQRIDRYELVHQLGQTSGEWTFGESDSSVPRELAWCVVEGRLSSRRDLLLAARAAVASEKRSGDGGAWCARRREGGGKAVVRGKPQCNPNARLRSKE